MSSARWRRGAALVLLLFSGGVEALAAPFARAHLAPPRELRA
jgi:hypothetical protein